MTNPSVLILLLGRAVVLQAMAPPEYGLEEFVDGVEALDMPDDEVSGLRF